MSSEISSDLARQHRMVLAVSKAPGGVTRHPKGHKPSKAASGPVHHPVNSGNRTLCTPHAEFRGRRMTELVTDPNQVALHRVEPLQMSILMSRNSQLHRLVKTQVDSNVNHRFTGYTKYTKLRKVTDKTDCVNEWPENWPHVTSVTWESPSMQPTTTMPPRKQPQCDQARSGPTKPNEKGKGGSEQPDPPSPVASGSQSKGKAPGIPAYTPGLRKRIPTPPKKKTPAQKRQEQQEAEEEYEASQPDPLFDPLEQDSTESQALRLLGLPTWQGANNLATTPSVSTSAGLPPSPCGVSPDQLLEPPTRTDILSSISSRGSKRPREPSPLSQPRRPPHCPSQRDLRAPHRQSPS